MNEWMLIVKDDVYKYKNYKRLMILAPMDMKLTRQEKIYIWIY